MFRGTAEVRFLPFDLPGSVRRFLDRARPRLAVIIETELWPNLYRQCRRRRIPLVIASARLSRRSIDRYRRLGALFKETVAGGVVIAAQGEGDAERFRALGAAAERTHVTGNLKFDLTLPPDISERGRALREQYAPSRADLGGGQHPWRSGGRGGARGPSARRPQSIPGRCWCSLRAIPTASAKWLPGWSGRESRSRGARKRLRRMPRQDGPNVLLLDTLGELLYFYAAADVAFVGGSLAPIGGHNLLEPAALGLPVLTGPNNSNGEDVARLLLDCGAAQDRTQRRGARLASGRAAIRSGAAGGNGEPRPRRRRPQSRRAGEAPDASSTRLLAN